jgi:hypothetical protein
VFFSSIFVFRSLVNTYVLKRKNKRQNKNLNKRNPSLCIHDPREKEREYCVDNSNCSNENCFASQMQKEATLR